MPRRVEIAAHVLVPAPASRVWDLVTDWDRQQDWMPGTRVSGGHGAGAELVARTEIGPVGFRDTMEITEWDPPRRCVMKHTGHLLRGEGLFEVSQAGEVSQFSWTERLQLPFAVPLPLLWWLLLPAARWGMAAALRRLARLL
ncbi:MAG TPA: SRPBCC family protein [Streptosporangiaceae bacterium]|jgi:carbon monoxide dehydrogenase subunit G